MYHSPAVSTRFRDGGIQFASVISKSVSMILLKEPKYKYSCHLCVMSAPCSSWYASSTKVPSVNATTMRPNKRTKTVQHSAAQLPRIAAHISCSLLNRARSRTITKSREKRVTRTRRRRETFIGILTNGVNSSNHEQQATTSKIFQMLRKMRIPSAKHFNNSSSTKIVPSTTWAISMALSNPNHSSDAGLLQEGYPISNPTCIPSYCASRRLISA
mmetsp:Transcript_29041/g.66786  ORF Transcript_29041/g.66786 Transcript_29041/m.66786 type:complete len:215 (+) Transcript_29041:748-1392(+)